MKCCICDNEIPVMHGWDGGNNAEPVTSGRCCHECNASVVIPVRLGDTRLLVAVREEIAARRKQEDK